jgi:hypothetical protein
MERVKTTRVEIFGSIPHRADADAKIRQTVASYVDAR